jgi:hypothetical protein
MDYLEAGLFEHLAANDSDERVADRKALAVISKRVKDRFGAFLDAAESSEEHRTRLALIEDDLKAEVASVIDEYGGDPQKVEASLRRTIIRPKRRHSIDLGGDGQHPADLDAFPEEDPGLPVEEFDAPEDEGDALLAEIQRLIKEYRDQGGEEEFEGEFEGIDEGFVHDPEGGQYDPATGQGGGSFGGALPPEYSKVARRPKRANAEFLIGKRVADHEGREGVIVDVDPNPTFTPSATIQWDDGETSGMPLPHLQYIEGVISKTARRPKLCPYHSEVMDISLTSGDPQAGFNSMAQHAWGPQHCQGGEYESRCNFKPEMVTQEYWDKKAEKAEERREQREQERQLMEEPLQSVEAPVEPSDEPVEEGINEELAEAPSAVGDGSEVETSDLEPVAANKIRAYAALTERGVPVPPKLAEEIEKLSEDAKMSFDLWELGQDALNTGTGLVADIPGAVADIPPVVRGIEQDIEGLGATPQVGPQTGPGQKGGQPDLSMQQMQQRNLQNAPTNPTGPQQGEFNRTHYRGQPLENPPTKKQYFGTEQHQAAPVPDAGGAVKTEDLPAGNEDALKGPSPEMDKGKSGDERGWTLKPIDTEMSGSPNPVEQQDVETPAEYDKKDFLDGTDAVNKSQELPTASEEGHSTEKNIETIHTDTWGDNNNAAPVTQETDADTLG